MDSHVRRAALVALALGTAAAPAVAEPGRGAELRRLQRAALRRAGIDPEEYEGLQRRTRLAPLLPQLTASVWRGLQIGRGDLQPLALGDPDRMSFSVTARWDLSRLIFSREELALKAQAERAAQRGQALGAEVARVYYDRERAQREPGEELRAAQLGATLEALTGERIDRDGIVEELPPGE